MSVDGFTTGRDITISFITPEVGPLSLSLITNWNAKQISSTQSPVGIDAEVRHARFFKGWSGSFKLERRDSTLDDYFALLEAAYWSGVDSKSASMTVTIAEARGNVTQWRFTKVLATYDDAGDYAGDATVKQSMSFLASKRFKIA